MRFAARALLLMLCAAALAGCGKGREPAAGSGQATATDEPAPHSGEQIDNPQYASWAKFPAGTTIVVRATSETEGAEGKTVTTTTTRLLEVTPDSVKLETQIRSSRYDGYEESNPPGVTKLPARLALPPGVKKEEFGKPAGDGKHGEEKVTAGGRSYAARWYKGKDRNEGGEVTSTTWASPEVPGTLLRSISRTSGVKKLVTTELVELTVPTP